MDPKVNPVTPSQNLGNGDGASGVDAPAPRASAVHRSLAVLAAALIALTGALAAAGVRGDAAGAAESARSAAVGDNWNFEAGDFSGWRTMSAGSGAWHVYSDGATAPDPADSDPNFPFAVPNPPEGRFAAVTDMSGPGTRILYRDVRLSGRQALRLTLFYVNHPVERFFAPRTLRFERCEPNQQFRIDVIDPSAPVDSMSARAVLATLFRTKPGDPQTIGPTTRSFDLSRWAGRTVRLRFAQVDNRGPLRAGIDDVRIEPLG